MFSAKLPPRTQGLTSQKAMAGGGFSAPAPSRPGMAPPPSGMPRPGLEKAGGIGQSLGQGMQGGGAQDFLKRQNFRNTLQQNPAAMDRFKQNLRSNPKAMGRMKMALQNRAKMGGLQRQPVRQMETRGNFRR